MKYPDQTLLIFLITLAISTVPQCELLNASEPATKTSSWTNWRGPNLNGSAAANAKPPIKWDSGTNIQWVADLKGEGTSTPIVWEDQIFVLSAEKTDRKGESSTPTNEASKTIRPDVFYRFLVTCIDRNSGKTIWQKLAAEEVPHEGKHDTHTYAAGSPVTDGERLYASFGSRGLFCYSLDGELLWQQDLGDMRTRFGWGEAVTPALAGDLLIVNWDQETNSFITALDKITGKSVWKVDRTGEVTSWNTPLVTEWDGSLMAVVNGTERARAYDVRTGKELWSCGGQTVNAIPSPIRFENFVVCMSGYRTAAAYAIPLDSMGDLTGTGKTLWHHAQGTPYVPSPSLSGHRLLFTAANNGLLSCLDVRTGKPIADRRRINGVSALYASPLVAGGHAYLISRDGATAVLKDDDTLEEVALNKLSGTFDSSPVAVDHQLFLRSWTQLFCISDPGNR